MTTRSDHGAAARESLGTVALIAAVAIVLLQAIGSGTQQWPNLLAVVLTIVGAGLRIEAAVLRK